MKTLPCPFCGKAPVLSGDNPRGVTWGEVRCETAYCPARPSVNCGIDVPEGSDTEACQQAAIKRWNQRANDRRSKRARKT